MAPVSQPNPADAANAVRIALGAEVRNAHRFPTGLAHFVYDVELADGGRVVARLAADGNEDELRQGVEWSKLLRPRGVPLPAELANDFGRRTVPFAFVLLERLPGTDLGLVYPSLSRPDKASIVAELVRIQRLVHALPTGTRHGYAAVPDGGSFSTWTEMVESSHARVVAQLSRQGRNTPIVDRVGARLHALRPYLDRVVPRAFLDDTTTKNVIVHDGRLSGIVDVDGICYGDPLFTLGITHMSFLQLGYDLHYMEAWADELRLSADEREVVRVYAAMFGSSFLAEMAVRYNREEEPVVDPSAVARLLANIETLI